MPISDSLLALYELTFNEVYDFEYGKIEIKKGLKSYYEIKNIAINLFRNDKQYIVSEELVNDYYVFTGMSYLLRKETHKIKRIKIEPFVLWKWEKSRPESPDLFMGERTPLTF